MKTYKLIAALLVLAVAGPTIVTAQEERREQERREREEATRRVREAQEALAAAIQELQRERSAEANEALRRAIESARLAQRDLRADEIQDLYSRLYYLSPERNIVIAGTASRPRMGVILSSSTLRSATDSVGAVLQGVTPGGPADEAGLKAGDIIISANGERLGRVGRSDDAPDDKLVAKIGELEAGDTLAVVYRRDGETGNANVIVRAMEPASYSYSFSVNTDSLLRGRLIEELAAPNLEMRLREPMDVEVAPNMVWESPPGVFTWRLGMDWARMELVALDEDLGRYFGTSEGLLVVRAPKTEESQIRTGDVILRIGDRVPTSATHAMRIMRSYSPGETMQIEIMRDQRRQTLQVTVPERDRGFFWSDKR